MAMMTTTRSTVDLLEFAVSGDADESDQEPRDGSYRRLFANESHDSCKVGKRLRTPPDEEDAVYHTSRLRIDSDI